VGGRIILKCILEKKEGVVWAGLLWLREETNGRLLRTVINPWVP
jgi:hypothetical protein